MILYSVYGYTSCFFWFFHDSSQVIIMLTFINSGLRKWNWHVNSGYRNFLYKSMVLEKTEKNKNGHKRIEKTISRKNNIKSFQPVPRINSSFRTIFFSLSKQKALNSVELHYRRFPFLWNWYFKIIGSYRKVTFIYCVYFCHQRKTNLARICSWRIWLCCFTCTSICRNFLFLMGFFFFQNVSLLIFQTSIYQHF